MFRKIDFIKKNPNCPKTVGRFHKTRAFATFLSAMVHRTASEYIKQVSFEDLQDLPESFSPETHTHDNYALKTHTHNQ